MSHVGLGTRGHKNPGSPGTELGSSTKASALNFWVLSSATPQEVNSDAGTSYKTHVSACSYVSLPTSLSHLQWLVDRNEKSWAAWPVTCKLPIGGLFPWVAYFHLFLNTGQCYLIL